MSGLTEEFVVSQLCSATMDVCSTMLNVEVSPQTAFVQRTPEQPHDGLEGLVGLAGKCVGTGAVCCSPHLACYLSSCFLATPITAIDDVVLDAMGELTNMIIGNFKNAVEERVGPVAMSIPTVVCGRDVMTRAMKENEWIVVPFEVHGERLRVKVCFSRHSEAGLNG